MSIVYPVGISGLFFATMCAIAITLFLPLMIYSRRICAGQYRLKGESNDYRLIHTSLGELRISQQHEKLQFKERDGTLHTVAFADIQNIETEYTQSEVSPHNWHPLFNILFLLDDNGFYEICTINVVRKDNTRIPVFMAFQIGVATGLIDKVTLAITPSRLRQSIANYCLHVNDQLSEELAR